MQLIIVTIQKKFFSIEFQSPYGEIGNATGFAEIEKVVSRQRSFSPLTGKSVMQLKKLVKAVAWTLRFSPLTGKSVMQQGLPVSAHCADLCGALANLGCFSFK